eukprot:53911-Prorocentrum_minimum.AAC.1
MVSTMRSLLATRLLPVSVMSTMASTPGRRAFTSVAPQLNSTFTGMLRSAKNLRTRCSIYTSGIALPLGGLHQLGGDDGVRPLASPPS